MAGFMRGDVVVVPFAFSNLSAAKRRPALVVASLQGDDVILCQITSQAVRDRYAIPLAAADFQSGSLNQPSNIRPNRLFTADSQLILYSIGKLQPLKLTETIEQIVQIIRA